MTSSAMQPAHPRQLQAPVPDALAEFASPVFEGQASPAKRSNRFLQPRVPVAGPGTASGSSKNPADLQTLASAAVGRDASTQGQKLVKLPSLLPHWVEDHLAQLKVVSGRYNRALAQALASEMQHHMVSTRLMVSSAPAAAGMRIAAVPPRCCMWPCRWQAAAERARALGASCHSLLHPHRASPCCQARDCAFGEKPRLSEHHDVLDEIAKVRRVHELQRLEPSERVIMGKAPPSSGSSSSSSSCWPHGRAVVHREWPIGCAVPCLSLVSCLVTCRACSSLLCPYRLRRRTSLPCLQTLRTGHTHHASGSHTTTTQPPRYRQGCAAGWQLQQGLGLVSVCTSLPGCSQGSFTSLSWMV